MREAQPYSPSRVLPGTEDADDGVTEDADVVRQERLAGGASSEAFVGEVSPVVGKVPVGSVDHFADGGSGGGFVDEVLGAGEGGDEGLEGEVVDGSGVAAGGGVDQADGVLGEQLVGSPDEFHVVGVMRNSSLQT